MGEHMLQCLCDWHDIDRFIQGDADQRLFDVVIERRADKRQLCSDRPKAAGERFIINPPEPRPDTGPDRLAKEFRGAVSQHKPHAFGRSRDVRTGNTAQSQRCEIGAHPSAEHEICLGRLPLPLCTGMPTNSLGDREAA